MADLLIIRGIPGAGKSTLAKKMLKVIWNSIHFEADMYHVDQDGKYNWKPENVQKAHEWCFQSTRVFLTHGHTVIVSNTFTTKKEIQPYLELAAKLNKTVEIKICTGNYGNVHNVPQETLDKMKARWED